MSDLAMSGGRVLNMVGERVGEVVGGGYKGGMYVADIVLDDGTELIVEVPL